MNAIVFLPMLLVTIWTVLGLVAMARTMRRRRGAESTLPGITVLKPLAGADTNLEDNLRTVFEQDHPSFEVLFGVESPDDPAVAVAERVRARYPHVPSKIVVTPAGEAKNPKVRNLLGLLPHARHDACVISDSNVRVAPDYLSDLLETRARAGAGLVTNLVAGVGEETLGAAAECAQLNGFCTPGSCLPTSIGQAAIIGKSILFSQSELERLGGLRKVADVLAEDFVLGKMYEHAGLSLSIARTVVENVTGKVTLRGFFARQRRWAALRWNLAPFAFLLEGATNPLVLLLVALFVRPPHLFTVAAPWMLAVALLRDVGGWVLLRGFRRAYLPVVVLPVKDTLALLAFLAAPFTRTLSWRGRSLRLGAGTILYAADERKTARRPLLQAARTSARSTVKMASGMGVGRRVSRSTKTWTKCPSATATGRRATNTPSS